MSRSLVGVAAVSALAYLPVVLSQAQCFENYQCIFHHSIGSNEYSWDMHQLCRGPGSEYVYTDPLNHTFNFNICGNTSQICAPIEQGNAYPLYDSHGVAVQTWTDPPACDPQAPLCKDWDTGLPVCCTGTCEVLGTEFFQFSLIDPSNPMSGGVQFVHVGMPPDDSDPHGCPLNPATNLQRERQITFKLYCDSGTPANTLTILGSSEAVACSYVIEAQTAAACGVKGDPFDGYRNNPGDSFGFVILGSVLTIFVYGVWVFGDSKGWWEPIKSRMPSFCRCGRGGGGSSSSGSSSYSTGSYGGSYKAAGGSAATPITASAYGTA